MSEQSPDDDDLDELAKACKEVTQSQQRPAKEHRPGFIERWVENDRKEDEKYSNYLHPPIARFLSEMWTFVVLVLIFIVVKGLWMLLTSSADR